MARYSRLTIACQLRSRGGSRPELLRQLNRILEVSRDESGTEMYVISASPDDDVSVWLFEMFVDREAYERHRASAVHGEVVALLPQLCEPDGQVALLHPVAMKVDAANLSLAAEGRAC
jgi:quinol monooxygenase YgiN